MRLLAMGLLMAGVVAGGATAFAQLGRAPAQIDALVESDGVRAGAAVRLALRVRLSEGLHVQSNAPRDPAFIPTVLSIEAPAGVTIDAIDYPPSSDLQQAGLPQPLAVFGHEFTIHVRARVAATVAPGEIAILGRLRYQACNDRACFPPTTAIATWSVRVVPEGTAVAVQHPGVFAQAAAVPPQSAEPAPTPRTVVAMVRAAMATDFGRAEQIVRTYRAAQGVTPEMLLALSWLGRGALAAQKLDMAETYARETYTLGLAELKRRTMDQEDVFPIAFGAAIETLGRVAAERGQRSEAVAFLAGELQTYGGTSLHKRIQKNLNLLSLEGTVAPPLDLSESLGASPPTLVELKGRVVLLFFWAHWCSDCKAQGPILERLNQKYGSQGLVIVAPTQRFGYAAGGVAARPEEENRYIEQIRDSSYAWMARVPVTLNDTNHRRYGVSTTPTLTVVDRAGIVRLYRPGLMPEAELESLIQKLIASTSTDGAAR